MNLLIVDDEYLVVEEVVTVTDWGMLGITEIYSATNAVSAVRILNEKKIDIMICDIEMPQTDGLELSKKAKENFPDLEIVMLTSHAEFNYVRNALRYGCYDYLLKPVMEDDIIKVMKNLVTKIERERHQAQLQEEGIVWNQLKPVWKEKYWEEMLRGLRDDPNRECEEYEEKQWKEEQDRRLIPILFYQYANDKTEEDIKQTRKKVKEDLGTVAGDFLLPVLSQKEFAGLVFISDEWLSSGTERNGIILKDAILQQFKTERLYEKIGICIGEVCTGREVQSMVDKLRQFAWNNVCSRRQILDIINMPKNSEAIGMPDMTLWKAYIDNGKTVELQDIIRKWLWGKDNEAKLNRRALQMLQYDLEQLFYSTLQENGIQAHQFLYDRENGCNRVTAIGSLEEMDAWIEETMGAVSRIMQDVSNLSGISNEELQKNVIKDVTLLKLVGFKPIIVHGGGKEISRWVGKVGKEAKFVNGLRVTDEETMEIAEMVLNKVNKSLVTMVEELGVKAVGVSGKDGGLLQVEKKYSDGQDIGYVGEITGVNPDILFDMLEKDYLPIIAPIGLDKDYHTYNINADDAACAIAKAVHAEKLAFLTDIEGLYKDINDKSTFISRLTASEAEGLIHDGYIGGGMLPKLNNCTSAIRNGVNRVHILDGRLAHCLLLEIFTNQGIGTAIVSDEE